MSIPVLPFVASARDALAASDLVRRYGRKAAVEAATRADGARRLGNHIAFCRWRQIERLVGWLVAEAAPGSVH